jgi:hypothetical protein
MGDVVDIWQDSLIEGVDVLEMMLMVEKMSFIVRMVMISKMMNRKKAMIKIDRYLV